MSNNINVLLVNPWIDDGIVSSYRANPLGILTLASALEDMGCNTYFVDFVSGVGPFSEVSSKGYSPHWDFLKMPLAENPNLKPSKFKVPIRFNAIPDAEGFFRFGSSEEYIRNTLEGLPKIDVIFVTSIMTFWYTGVVDSILLLRSVFGKTPIVLGGIYPTLLSEHAAKVSGADFIVTGRGEEQLLDILKVVTPKEVPNKEAGVQNKCFLPNLDHTKRNKFLTLMTSRGCPFCCTYCASKLLYDKFVQYDPSVVVDYVKKYVDGFGSSDIILFDDATLINFEKHLLPILRGVDALGVKVKWHTPNAIHAASVDSLVANSFKRYGFSTIRLALESSSIQFQYDTGHKVDNDSFLRAAGHLHNAGFSQLDIGVFIMAGFPNQTISDVYKDVSFVLDSGASPYILKYSPIPGTEMWKKLRQDGKYSKLDEPLYQNPQLFPVADPSVNLNSINRIYRDISLRVLPQ